MRYRIAAVLGLVLALSPAIASAKGPSGSKDSGQVKCGKGAALPVATLYAGTNGAELCSGENIPPDGRIIVTPGYVTIDGDASNPGDSSGFLRVDKSGPSCGDAKHKDGTKKGGSCVPKPPKPPSGP